VSNKTANEKQEKEEESFVNGAKNKTQRHQRKSRGTKRQKNIKTPSSFMAVQKNFSDLLSRYGN
jgi:hypothetical protein